MLGEAEGKDMKRRIKFEDTKYGDFHVHTNYTDGENTVAKYCKKALQNNLKAIAFTEHVRKNLDYNFNEFVFDIEKAKEEISELTILSGCEAKVLNIDGELNVSEKVLGQCDVVIGVFHSFKWKDKKSYLVALKSMLRSQIADIWGHPTLFVKKHNIKLEENELKEIINVCIENNVLIERNLKYNVPDANFIRLALKKGAKFVVGSDAHNINELLTINRLKEEWNWINKIY